MSEAFDKIMRGLVEAHKFCVTPEDYAAGIIVHQFQSDGTVRKISPQEFFEPIPPSSGASSSPAHPSEQEPDQHQRSYTGDGV